MTVFDGLYLYEIVLLFMGVILFIAALIALFTKKSYAAVVPIFLISVVMVAYPSIQSVSYENGKVTIQTKARELLKDPTNDALRKSLQQDLAKVSARPTSDPKTAVTFAQAQLAVGQDELARQNLNKALQANPHLQEAQELKHKFELSDNLEALTAKVAQTPSDAAAKTELQNTTSELNKIGVANPKILTNMARAYGVLGNNEQAHATVDKAIKIDPNLSAAKEVKSRLVMVNPTINSR